MKCSNCGFEQDTAFAFCPNCGTPAEGGTGPNENNPEINDPDQGRPKVTFTAKSNVGESSFKGETPYAAYQPQPVLDISTMNPWQRATAFLRDGSFLGVCILLTANVVLGLFSIVPAISVIRILFVIFFWIAYAAAYKYRLEVKHIRWISGTCAAKKIVSYVIAGIILAGGVISMVALSAVGVSGLSREIMKEIPGAMRYHDYIAPLLSASGAVVLIGCVLVAAIFFVFAFFGYRSFHFFVRSVYRSVETGVFAIEKRSAVSAWLIVCAVFAGLGALGSGIINFVGLITSVAECIAYILLNILVNRYYKDM